MNKDIWTCSSRITCRKIHAHPVSCSGSVVKKNLIMKVKQRKKRRPTLRRDDTVIVISGKDKGRTGRVVSVDWKRERMLVEGVNIVTRHTKPNPANQQGGLIKTESPVHYSNVQLYNPTLKRGVRVKIQTSDAGVKNRVCAKSGEILG